MAARKEKERSLKDVAQRVNWYTPPARVLANQNLFLCEVMARGLLEDIVAVRKHYPWEAFKEAYVHAPPGLFSPRVWAFWGLKLLGDPKALPLPQRFPGKPFDWRKAGGSAPRGKRTRRRRRASVPG